MLFSMKVAGDLVLGIIRIGRGFPWPLMAAPVKYLRRIFRLSSNNNIHYVNMVTGLFGPVTTVTSLIEG